MRVFDRPGPVNTDKIIEIIQQSAPSFQTIVAASITGGSAVRIAECIPLKRTVCITCPQGMAWEVNRMESGPFAEVPELQQIRDEWLAQGLQRVAMNVTPENRAILEQYNVPIIQGTIPFFGPTFSMRLHLHHVSSLDILAKTLELFSTGTLVCLECVLMAVDAGAIPEGEIVMAVAGTERGLDTAWLIRSCASANLFHPTRGARFVECLAKPGISRLPEMEIPYLR